MASASATTISPSQALYSDVSRYFRVVESSTALVFHAISLVIMVRIARVLSRANASIMLKTFIIVWIIDDVLSVPYGVFITFWWRPVYLDYYVAGSIWSVLWERSFSCTLPIAVFFLTLDRSIALVAGIGYRRRHARILCVSCCSLIAVVSLTSVCIYMFVYPALLTADDVTKPTNVCSDSLCFFSRPDDFQFLIRVFFGSLNVICSVAFFFLLRNENKKRAAMTSDKRARSRGSTFVMYAIASEVFLNFVPHASALHYEIQETGRVEVIRSASDALTARSFISWNV